ncbi:MAG: Crp/Fnr family transcriptional regulator, partial [Chloroflexota bacterium]
GETFNDVPVFDGGPNPASAQAAAPGTAVCMVPTAVVMELLMTNPRVAADIVHVLAGRLRHLTAVVEDLSFHHITDRVAKLLLAESAATDSRPLLTQERMATRIGTAREVVSRALRTLEQQGAITRQRNRIVAINVPILRALLERGSPPDQE